MSKIRVLIIDDHRLMREGLKAILESEPDLDVVAEATTGNDGVVLVRKLKPDVVLVDIRLPDMDGIEATRQIRQWCKQTSVLVLTMHDREEYLVAALKAGAVGYLIKDTPGPEVARAIRSTVAGGSWITPIMARKLVDLVAQGRVGALTEFKPMLTERELQVLSLMAQGASNREIAQRLFLAEKTVKQHATRIFKKLNVRSRSQAVLYAVQHGLAG